MGRRATSNPQAIADAVKAFVERLIKQIIADIVANLRRDARKGGSPVKTGWLRANWVATIGEPFEGTVGTKAQARAGNVDNAAGEQAVNDVSTRYTLDQGSAFVSNNVPYVVLRNEFGGIVAQPLFVQRSIHEAVDRARARRRG